MLTAAASSHALKTAPQRSPSGRLRNSQTPWPWRTERPPNQSQEQVPWMPERPFWNPTRNLLLSCYCARILSYPAILLFRNTAETAKHHLISFRKWRKINHKNKFPGDRNVPSEIVLEILSNPAISYPAMLQASKMYPSPHRNTMALKDGTTSKSIAAARTSSLGAGTSLLKSY